MTYCSAAGLQDDSRALQALTDPFKGACRATSSHQNKIQTPEKLKWSSRDQSLVPSSVMTFPYLIVPLPSYNPQSVNHECTCTGLMRHILAKGCTLHSLLA